MATQISVLSAKRGKAPRKKLKCQPGYEQRGAVCQKINPKRKGLKTAAAAALAAGAIAGGVALANKKRNADPPPPTKAERRKRAIERTMGAAVGTYLIGKEFERSHNEIQWKRREKGETVRPSPYATSRRTDAKSALRPKKLKCKPGYEQRGAVCQKISSRKRRLKSIAGGVAATAIAAGAVAAARNMTKPKEPPSPTATATKNLANIGKATASVLGVLGVGAALEQRRRRSFPAAKKVTEATNIYAEYLEKEKAKSASEPPPPSTSESDRPRDRSLSPRLNQFREAALKFNPRATEVKRAGSINSVFIKDEKSYVAIGEAGEDTFVALGSQKLSKEKKNGLNHYSVGISVNGFEGADRDPQASKARMGRIVNQSYKMLDFYAKDLEDNSIIEAEIYGGDGKGEQRGLLYTKSGFKSVPGVNPSKKFLIKEGGKLRSPYNERDFKRIQAFMSPERKDSSPKRKKLT